MDSEGKHLASYLCVSCGKITTDKESKIPTLKETNGCQVRGCATIIKYLAKKSNIKDILGHSQEDEAVVNQWLEYRATQIVHANQEKDIHSVLKDLNVYLSDRVYLVGFYSTIADISLYLALYSIMSELTFSEKQLYLHLSRWFDQVQHIPGVQQGLKKVYFQKNLIYVKGSH